MKEAYPVNGVLNPKWAWLDKPAALAQKQYGEGNLPWVSTEANASGMTINGVANPDYQWLTGDQKASLAQRA